MTRLSLKNNFDSPITVYTCSVNLTMTAIIYRKVTEISQDNQTFLLDTDQTSDEFPTDSKYPYLIIIYTVDNTNYGVFDIIDCSNGSQNCILNLVNSNTSPDVSLLYGYDYVKLGNKTEVQIPIFMKDITKYVDENSCPDGSVKFGNVNDELLPVPTICINQEILKTINSSSKKETTLPKVQTRTNSDVQTKITEITQENEVDVPNIRKINIQFSFYFIILLLIFVGLIWFYLY